MRFAHEPVNRAHSARYRYFEVRGSADRLLLLDEIEQAMRHTLQVTGRAILFATLINAGGFLAFTLAELPPMREFGLLAALAFLLSMLADFTALPAALWILFRARPDADPPVGRRPPVLPPRLDP